jgi:hypothetical protein
MADMYCTKEDILRQVPEFRTEWNSGQLDDQQVKPYIASATWEVKLVLSGKYDLSLINPLAPDQFFVEMTARRAATYIIERFQFGDKGQKRLEQLKTEYQYYVELVANGSILRDDNSFFPIKMPPSITFQKAPTDLHSIFPLLQPGNPEIRQDRVGAPLDFRNHNRH